ncbi:protein SERAC1 [Marchantia polymorpha subsp. ruderalis]
MRHWKRRFTSFSLTVNSVSMRLWKRQKRRSGSRRKLTTMDTRSPATRAFARLFLFFHGRARLYTPDFTSPDSERYIAHCARNFRETGYNQTSDSVYELSSASEYRTDVVFFHGLRPGPAGEHLSTWRSKTGEVWLKWLHKYNPSLRILAVSYDASMKKDSRNGRMDIYQVSENLLRELITRGVGQTGPVIFVGHSFGGIISKEICRQAHQNRDLGDDILKRTTLLKNLRGLFCFGVPHRGSLFTNVVEKLNFEKGELVDYVKVLNKDLARLNDVFDRLCTKYEWKVAGVGESKPTKLRNGFCDIIVEEASARCGDFSILEEDHFSLCQSKSRDSSSYTILVEFFDKIQRKVTNIATND